jgi:hypothetical protein
MINVEKFLLENKIKQGSYALVTHNNKTEATWFTRYNFGQGDWFLESPCELYRLMEIEEPIEEFARKYIDGLLEEGEDKQAYIEQWVIPMIVNNVLYEIENFQCSPYLPKEVDDIKLISERECLEYLLNIK